MARRPFYIEDSALFEIDDASGQLYFNGKAVKTELVFPNLLTTTLEKILAGIVGVATFLSFVAVTLHDGQEFLLYMREKKMPPQMVRIITTRCPEITQFIFARSQLSRIDKKTPCETQTYMIPASNIGQ